MLMNTFTSLVKLICQKASITALLQCFAVLVSIIVVDLFFLPFPILSFRLILTILSLSLSLSSSPSLPSLSLSVSLALCLRRSVFQHGSVGPVSHSGRPGTGFCSCQNQCGLWPPCGRGYSETGGKDTWVWLWWCRYNKASHFLTIHLTIQFIDC